jgi:protein-L-isoaspartate(D-aspartate) O-methyltransferase
MKCPDLAYFFIIFGVLGMNSCDKHKGINLNSDDHFRRLCDKMVRTQIEARGVRDPQVLSAMRKVPRHKFVPEQEIQYAYEDNPLPIGYQQTISQPYIVAYMTEALRLKKSDRVLEIGTGSGYQAAVLAEIADSVYTIEIVEPLCRQAQATLAFLKYKNVFVKCGDGYLGWPEHAPFDAIILTAAPEIIPQSLLDQLGTGGRLIAPIGKYIQDLILYTKMPDGTIDKRDLISVRFVPMTGKAQQR